MNRIRKLEALVVDQIAAGEVVERPASVVKELLENALDAGAQRIELSLREGGRRRIEVRDDGCGIAEADLPLAVHSHATSKLQSVRDLDAIGTLGFRGEALASIAAVSRFELISRPREASAAARLRVNFGRAEAVRAAAGPPGTRILVEDLFAELPARLKFLKTAQTELSHCSAWLERLALAHVGVAFKLEHEGKLRLDLSAEEDLRARCGSIFGSGLAERMVELNERREGLELEALVGPPEAARRNATRVHLFLNGRWVRDPALLRAVREGVREFVPIGHYPTLYLAIAVPPDRVDVNVHPQKLEVRFRDERLIFGSVVRMLQRGLSQSSWATRKLGEIGSTASEVQEGRRPSSAIGSGSSSGRLGFPSPTRGWERPLTEVPPAGADQRIHGGPFGEEGEPLAPTADGNSSEGAVPLAKGARGEALQVGAVLSVADTYLVRETEGGMEIFDQHALHERINLEELRLELQAGQVVSQALLVPALVELDRLELQRLCERAEDWRKLGVELEAFGETTLALRAVPARLDRLDPEGLVRDLLEIATQHRKASPDQIQEESLQRMACRAAVMAGDRLDGEALRDLIRRGAHLPQAKTCAHGRPVRVFLTLEDLERAFHRR